MTDEQVLKELITFAAFHKQKAPFPSQLQLAIDGGNALVAKLFASKVPAAKSTYIAELQEGLKNALKIVGETEFKWAKEKWGEDKGDHIIESAFKALQALPDCGVVPSMGHIPLNIVLALEKVLDAAENWHAQMEEDEPTAPELKAEIDMLDAWYKGTKVGDPQNAAPPAAQLSPELIDQLEWVIAGAIDGLNYTKKDGMNYESLEEALPAVTRWLEKTKNAGSQPLWKTFGLTQLQVERAAKIMDLVADNLGSEDERTDYCIAATALQTILQGSIEAITMIGDET